MPDNLISGQFFNAYFLALVSLIKIDHSLTPSHVPILGTSTMPAAEASLDVTLTGAASKSF